MKPERMNLKEVIEWSRRMAVDFGTEKPDLSFKRRLYPAYLYGSRVAREFVAEETVVSLRFRMIADEETVSAFSAAIRTGLDDSLIDIQTSVEVLEGKSVMLREITVQYHLKERYG